MYVHIYEAWSDFFYKSKANQMKNKNMYKTSLQDNPRSIFKRGTIKVPAGSEAYVLNM